MTKQLLNIIKTEKQYDEYMAEIISLLDDGLHPGTNEFDRFEHLSLLVQHYEERNFPIEKPSPIDAIKFRMDQQGLTNMDMRKYIGSASKVSEVLSGKRTLSLSMIKRLHDGLGIPADILIQDMKSKEWNLIGIDEDYITVTTNAPMFKADPAMFMTESAIEMGYFSGKTEERYVSTTMQEVDMKATRRVGTPINDIDNFLIIKDSHSSLTATSAKIFETKPDRNYTLAS